MFLKIYMDSNYHGYLKNNWVDLLLLTNYAVTKKTVEYILLYSDNKKDIFHVGLSKWDETYMFPLCSNKGHL